MKRRIISVIAVGLMIFGGVMLSSVAFTSCEKDPVNNVDPDQDPDPDPDPDPETGTSTAVEFDDSELTAANHPRVIYSDEEFAKLAALYEAGTNSYFSEVHKNILYNADKYVGASDLERTFSGIRMTTSCYTAENRILHLAYAYKTTGESKYLEQAEHDLKTVCTFEDWNAGGHALDVGEMSVGVGLAYDWLYNDLAESTRNTIRAALKNFAFDPFLNNKATDNIYTSTFNNHNQIINAGLIASALATYEDDPDTATSIIKKGVPSNLISQAQCYSPYGNDYEGYMYYAYGTLFEVTLLAALETVLDNDYGLSAVQGFENSPNYMLFMEGPTGYCFNYGDSDASNAPCLPQWYFAWKFGNMDALFLEKDRVAKYSSQPRLVPVIAYFIANVNVSNVSTPSEHLYYAGGTTPVVALHTTWSMDSNDRYLGIKGGSGDGGHSHLDLGSFVYDEAGVRWCVDYGKQDYASAEAAMSDFWSYKDGSGRWTLFRFNNFNHNTLTINDAYHKSSGYGDFSETFYDENGKKGATIDITEAFNGQASSVIRSVYLDGDDLVVEDQIKALSGTDANIRWTLVTYAEPTLSYGVMTLKKSGKTRYLACSDDVDWTTFSTVGENKYDADNTGYYECGYTTTVPANTTRTITVRLTSVFPN